MSKLVVPGEVGAAVVTRRVEFLAGLRTRIKAGDRPSDLEILNLIDLVEEGIRRAEAEDERFARMAKRFEGARGQLKGLAKALDAMERDCSWDEPSEHEGWDILPDDC